jgi:hypothetical protein
MRSDVWKAACNSICMRIKGYSELLRSEDKTDADTIYMQASACNRIESMHAYKHCFLSLCNLYFIDGSRLCMCVYLVLENAWELTRRMLHRKKMIQVSDQDRIKREKFVETYRRTRLNHKNYKPKLEPSADTSNEPLAALAASGVSEDAADAFSDHDEADASNIVTHPVTLSQSSSSANVTTHILNRSDARCCEFHR